MVSIFLTKVFDCCLKIIVTLLVCVYLLVAIYFFSGRYFLPQLASYSQTIENVLTKKTGLQWSITELSAELRGINPVIYFKGITASKTALTEQLKNTETQSTLVLSVRSGSVYVDVFSSLIRRELRLYGAKGGDVEILLQKNGNQLSLAGLEATKKTGHFNFLGFVDNLKYFSLDNLSVAVQREIEQRWDILALPAIKISLERMQSQRALSIVQSSIANSASAELVKQKEFNLSVVSSGGFFNSQSIVVGQLKDENHYVEKWANVFLNNWQLKESAIDIWFKKEAEKYELHAPTLFAIVEKNVVEPVAAELKEKQKSSSLVYEIDVNLALFGNEKNSQLVWQNLSLHKGSVDFLLPAGQMDLAVNQRAQKEIFISVQEVDLDLVSNTLNDFEFLTPSLTSIVNSLNLKGMLQQVSFKFPLENPSKFHLNAELKKVDVSPWKGAPGATNINGHLFLTAKKGEAQLNSTDGFSLSFPHVYRSALTFATADAVVNWRITDQRYFVSSNNIALTSLSDNASYGGQFAVNGRMYKAGDPSHLMLNIGVTSAQAKNLLAYIPYIAPENLLSWIEQSKVAGYVKQGAFIYNGPLRRSKAQKHSISAAFQLVDSELFFYPGWPQLRDINGQLTIDNSLVDIKLTSGKLHDFLLEPSVATINADAGYVDVDAVASGDVNGVLSFLRQAPLSKPLANQLKGWQGDGEFKNAKVGLHIPYSKKTLDDLVVDIRTSLIDAQLDMSNLDISLKQLNGDISFDSEKGLYTEQLSASLWGHEVDLKLGDYGETEIQSGMTSLKINAESTLDVASINGWLKQPALAFLSGEALFEFSMIVSDTETTLSLGSDLLGVEIDAPDLLSKTQKEPAIFDLHWDLESSLQPMKLSINNRLVADFNFESFHFIGGLLVLGNDGYQRERKQVENAVIDKRGKLVVTGFAESLNLTPWERFVDDYIEYEMKISTEQHTAVTEAKEIDLIIDGFRTDQLTAFGEKVNHVVFDVEHSEDRWVFAIESDQFGGQIKLPKIATIAGNEPNSTDKENSLQALPQLNEGLSINNRLIVDLDFLYFPEKKNDSSLDTVNRTSWSEAWDMPDLQVDISQLYIGNKNVGKWHFLFSGGDRIALVHDINISYASLDISSDIDAGLLWAEDQHGNIVSSLDADINSSALSKFINVVMKKENVSPLLSKNFTADLSINWDGLPENIDFKNVDGSMKFNFASGRFLKTANSATGLLKILGLVNFDALVRRIRLDFSDVYKEGLSFDRITGELDFVKNRIEFLDNPINVYTPSSKFSLVGSLDINEQVVDAELIATLPIATNLPWIAALAGGLPVAAGAFIVTKVLDKQLNKLSSAVYRVSGSLDNPDVKFDRLFDDQAKK